GPYSRTLDRGAIGRSIDGRSREGRFLRAFETMLTQHIGAPSAAQRVLISRAARLALRLELFDRKADAAGDMSERDSRQYLAWSNGLSRLLRTLGLEGRATAQPTLAELLSRDGGW